MGKKSVETCNVMSSQETIAFLQDLQAGFEAGVLCVRKGAEFLTLQPGEKIEVEVEATVKKDKQKLVVELSWREAEKTEERHSLRITTSEPPSLDVAQADAAATQDGLQARPLSMGGDHCGREPGQG